MIEKRLDEPKEKKPHKTTLMDHPWIYQLIWQFILTSHNHISVVAWGHLFIYFLFVFINQNHSQFIYIFKLLHSPCALHCGTTTFINTTHKIYSIYYA